MTSSPGPTPPASNQFWWDRAFARIDRHPFYKGILVFGAVAAVVGPIMALGDWLPSMVARKGEVDQVAAQPTDQRAPIVTTLSDGMVVAISPAYESRFKKEDVLLAHKEMSTPENAEVLARASAKRHTLRTIGGLTLKDILLLRTSIEDTVLKGMQGDMGPKGMTILSFSLGEISRK